MCLIILGVLFLLAALYWLLPYLLIGFAGFVVVGAALHVGREVSERRKTTAQLRGDQCLGISNGLGIETYYAKLKDAGVIIHVRLRNTTDEPIDLSSAQQVDIQVFSGRGPIEAETWLWTKTELPPRTVLNTRIRVPTDFDTEVTQWAIAHHPGEHLFFPIKQ